MGKKHSKKRKQYLREQVKEKIKDLGRTAQEADTGTPELQKRAMVEVTGEGTRKRARVLNHILDVYRSKVKRKVGVDGAGKPVFAPGINASQYRAGCLFYNDWAVSHKFKSTLGSLGLTQDMMARAMEISDVHTAYERYARALRTLSKVSKVVATKVCIEGDSLAGIREDMGWAWYNTGIDRLRETLDELAEFYEREYHLRKGQQGKAGAT